ncbi:MAG: hypothetical protein QMD36_03410 [Candidatus Aenigmarchaeota archaeon]|nr:hypothetical protein [Candidatus Aenigmarchaeota archaeon]
MGWEKNPWKTDFSKKYSWNGSSLKIPINKSLFITLILIIVIGFLSYINYTTSNYVAILEINKTSLENHLSTCKNEIQSLSSDLNTCNTNFGICRESLSNRTLSLNKCENEKSSLDSALSTCNDNLEVCEDDLNDFYHFLNERNLDDLNDLRYYISDLKNDKSDCESSLSACNNDKNTLISNYAKDYCCSLNKTHYTVSNNRVICGASGTALTC